MNERVGAAPVPAWFWIVTILAVAWEGFGAYVYLQLAMTEMGARGESYASMANWQWWVFAIAVWSGVAGALALVLRSRWASILLVLSLAAAAIQYGYAAAMGAITSADLPIALTVLVAGMLLVVFASIARRKGWLR